MNPAVTCFIGMCVLNLFAVNPCCLLFTIVVVVVDLYDDSMKAAKAALELQPDHPSALSTLALVYRKIGRSEEAEQLYQR